MATNANICGLVKGVINEAEKYNDIENKCAVCLEPTLTKTNCGHFICFECYAEWTKNKSNCPTCRREYGGRLFHYHINTFMKYAKNYMRKLKCELCEKLKCECSVIDKTFYNAIPPTIYAEFDDDKIKFYRQHRDILDEYLIREFIYGECATDSENIQAEKKIKITFWGKNKFTIYKDKEDWKEGITINYCVFQDDLIRDIDGEMLNTLTRLCRDKDIRKFLYGYDVSMTEIAISLLKNAGGYHLCDFLRSRIFCEGNTWEEYILEKRLFKNWNEFPYTIINDFDGDDYLKSCDYSERYAYIYEASDDLMNGVISAEYEGECDESEESEESEEDEEIDWEKEEREINERQGNLHDFGVDIMAEKDKNEKDKLEKKYRIYIIELENRKLRLAKFKLASKNALFKIIA